MIVILSYFHTRIGTSIFYSFPETPLGKEISDRLYDIMTQQDEEDFFIHSFENLKILNYYFQIPSEWARRKKEMVMISIIISQKISPEIEESISLLCKGFSEQLKSNENVYTGFYAYELNKHDAVDKERIIENERLIKQTVQDLYWETVEETRKKSEEEKITLLLNDPFSGKELLKKIKEKLEKKDEGPFEVEDEDEDEDGGDYEFFAPFPTIPPGSPGAAGDGKKKVPVAIMEKHPEHDPYCKHCGAELPKGQTICHVCGISRFRF